MKKERRNAYEKNSMQYARDFCACLPACDFSGTRVGGRSYGQ